MAWSSKIVSTFVSGTILLLEKAMEEGGSVELVGVSCGSNFSI